MTSTVTPDGTSTPTPTPTAGPVPIPRSGNRRRTYVMGAIIVAALVFLLVRGLGNATLYFRTADEAVAHRQQLGERRFRLEGTVVLGSLKADGTLTDFSVTNNGTVVQVRNSGQPTGIFREGIPVVLEGHFLPASNAFASDLIMVRHSADYVAKHPERVTTTVPAGAPAK